MQREPWIQTVAKNILRSIPTRRAQCFSPQLSIYNAQCPSICTPYRTNISTHLDLDFRTSDHRISCGPHETLCPVSTHCGPPARVPSVRFYPLDKLAYTEDERGIILQNLKNLALFVQSVNDAKKKVNK